jgi:hypothetical protein
MERRGIMDLGRTDSGRHLCIQRVEMSQRIEGSVYRKWQ